MTKRPNLKTVRRWIHYVPLVRRIDAMKANAILPATDERNVLGVRPAKRHCRASGATAPQSCVWQVGPITNLFGEHSALIREILHRSDARFSISTSSEYVTATFSRQTRTAA